MRDEGREREKQQQQQKIRREELSLRVYGISLLCNLARRRRREAFSGDLFLNLKNNTRLEIYIYVSSSIKEIIIVCFVVFLKFLVKIFLKIRKIRQN